MWAAKGAIDMEQVVYFCLSFFLIDAILLLLTICMLHQDGDVVGLAWRVCVWDNLYLCPS
jgi:hypothetical protein